jgi:integrase
MAIIHRKTKERQDPDTGKVVKKAESRYLVRITTADGGKRQQVIGTFKTKREAEKAERDALTMRDRGTLIAPSKTTVADLLDDYMRTRVPMKVRPENRDAYRSVIDRHVKPALGHVPVQRLTVEHVEAMMSEMLEAGYSTSLITKARMRLASALDMAMAREGFITRNVAKAAEPPGLTYREGKVWAPAEVEQFLDVSAGHDLWPLWLLFVETGARQSELLGLAWDEHVDLDAGTLRLGWQVVRLLNGAPILKKGGKTPAALRTIRLTPSTVAELRTFRTSWLERKLAGGPTWNPDGLLFTTATGKPISPNNLGRAFRRLVRKAGVEMVTLHSLRKGAITMAIANGAPVKAVSRRAGHADSRITLDTYSRVVATMDDDLLEIVQALVPPRSTRKA